MRCGIGRLSGALAPSPAAAAASRSILVAIRSTGVSIGAGT